MDDDSKVTFRITVHGRIRARTISDKRGRKPPPANYPLNVIRPKTRGDCVGGHRPCPFVSCRHHLYLDVNPRTGSLKLNFPHLEPWELKETCSLDVADMGGKMLEEVGELANITRERARQIESICAEKLEGKLEQWKETA